MTVIEHSGGSRDRVRSVFQREFTLALGGGGARGWAHIGVARALEEVGLKPARIVGTSMGSIIGAGMAAGVPAGEMKRLARQVRVYRLVRRRVPLALFDHRPVLEVVSRALGDPRIEDLPIPLAVTSLDLVSGKPAVIRSGRLADALERSIAVPFFFPPTFDAEGAVWCDAGPWEAVPVSAARQLSDDPVVGVHVDAPKSALLETRAAASVLRRLAIRLGGPRPHLRTLSLRRYLALLTAHLAEPVLREPPDLLIAPNLGLTTAWQFSRVGPMVERGYRAARVAIHGLEAELPTPRYRRFRVPRVPAGGRSVIRAG